MEGPERPVPRGWRYTAAVQLSDAGCSDDEVQAVTGLKTMEMVRKYRAKRDQRGASKRAREKEVSENGTGPEQETAKPKVTQ